MRSPIMMLRPWLGAAAMLAAVPIPPQAGEYLSNQALAQELSRLADQHPQQVRLVSAAKSLGAQTVWLAELGTGTVPERSRRPALRLRGQRASDTTPVPPLSERHCY